VQRIKQTAPAADVSFAHIVTRTLYRHRSRATKANGAQIQQNVGHEAQNDVQVGENPGQPPRSREGQFMTTSTMRVQSLGHNVCKGYIPHRSMTPAHTKIISRLHELDRLSSLLVRRSGARNSAHRPLLPRFHADEVFAPYGLHRPPAGRHQRAAGEACGWIMCTA
jgi:hypothetical protein